MAFADYRSLREQLNKLIETERCPGGRSTERLRQELDRLCFVHGLRAVRYVLYDIDLRVCLNLHELEKMRVTERSAERHIDRMERRGFARRPSRRATA